MAILPLPASAPRPTAASSRFFARSFWLSDRGLGGVVGAVHAIHGAGLSHPIISPMPCLRQRRDAGYAQFGWRVCPAERVSQPPAPNAKPVNARLRGNPGNVPHAATSGGLGFPAPHRADQQQPDREQPHGQGGDVGPVQSPIVLVQGHVRSTGHVLQPPIANTFRNSSDERQSVRRKCTLPSAIAMFMPVPASQMKKNSLCPTRWQARVIGGRLQARHLVCRAKNLVVPTRRCPSWPLR